MEYILYTYQGVNMRNNFISPLAADHAMRSIVQGRFINDHHARH